MNQENPSSINVRIVSVQINHHERIIESVSLEDSLRYGHRLLQLLVADQGPFGSRPLVEMDSPYRV